MSTFLHGKLVVFLELFLETLHFKVGLKSFKSLIFVRIKQVIYIIYVNIYIIYIFFYYSKYMVLLDIISV